MIYDHIKTEKRNSAHLQIYVYVYTERERVYVYILFSKESTSPCHVINYK